VARSIAILPEGGFCALDRGGKSSSSPRSPPSPDSPWLSSQDRLNSFVPVASACSHLPHLFSSQVNRDCDASVYSMKGRMGDDVHLPRRRAPMRHGQPPQHLWRTYHPRTWWVAQAWSRCAAALCPRLRSPRTMMPLVSPPHRCQTQTRMGLRRRWASPTQPDCVPPASRFPSPPPPPRP
jgi:hypothetical protein